MVKSEKLSLLYEQYLFGVEAYIWVILLFSLVSFILRGSVKYICKTVWVSQIHLQDSLYLAAG